MAKKKTTRTQKRLNRQVKSTRQLNYDTGPLGRAIKAWHDKRAKKSGGTSMNEEVGQRMTQMRRFTGNAPKHQPTPRKAMAATQRRSRTKRREF